MIYLNVENSWRDWMSSSSSHVISPVLSMVKVHSLYSYSLLNFLHWSDEILKKKTSVWMLCEISKQQWIKMIYSGVGFSQMFIFEKHVVMQYITLTLLNKLHSIYLHSWTLVQVLIFPDTEFYFSLNKFKKINETISKCWLISKQAFAHMNLLTFMGNPENNTQICVYTWFLSGSHLRATVNWLALVCNWWLLGAWSIPNEWRRVYNKQWIACTVPELRTEQFVREHN